MKNVPTDARSTNLLRETHARAQTNTHRHILTHTHTHVNKHTNSYQLYGSADSGQK